MKVTFNEEEIDAMLKQLFEIKAKDSMNLILFIQKKMKESENINIQTNGTVGMANTQPNQRVEIKP